MAYVFRSQDRDLDGFVTRKEVELTGPRAVAAFEEAGGRASGTLELPAFLDFSMQHLQRGRYRRQWLRDRRRIERGGGQGQGGAAEVGARPPSLGGPGL